MHGESLTGKEVSYWKKKWRETTFKLNVKQHLRGTVLSNCLSQKAAKKNVSGRGGGTHSTCGHSKLLYQIRKDFESYGILDACQSISPGESLETDCQHCHTWACRQLQQRLKQSTISLEESPTEKNKQSNKLYVPIHHISPKGQDATTY